MVLLLSAVLFPIFKSDASAPADPAFFQQWQQDSEALVLGKIESTTPRAPQSDTASAGLLAAQPNQMTPSSTFDELKVGQKPAAESYWVYPAQLGLQGFFFTALYHLGISDFSGLYRVSVLLTVLSLIAFALALARAGRRSLAGVFLAASATSPWLVAAARNLYWVPWTWFLPAAVAVWFCSSRGRARIAATVVLGLAFALRWGCGYEFLTCFTLLAMGMPFIGHVMGRLEGGVRLAVTDALKIFLLAVGTFIVIVVIQAFVVGRGDFASGMNIVIFDAAKRTYGGLALNNDLLTASVNANPLSVVGSYFFNWNTDVLHLSLGSPFDLSLSGSTFWLIVLAAVAAPVVRAVYLDRYWRRDATLLAVALSVPVSWFLLAKGHSYVHPHIDFVLWYLITVSVLLWVISAALVDLTRRFRAGGLRADRPRFDHRIQPE